MPRLSLPERLRAAGSKAAALARSIEPGVLRSLAPAVVPLALAPFVVAWARCELKEPLFSNTLVFQYTGWCIRHGLRLYRDVGMTDGPFIHYLQASMQLFVGMSDRGFRKADLFLQVAGSAVMGASVAPAAHAKRAVRWMDRAVWALLSVTVWLAWYFTFRWENTTEREAFYGLFGSTGLALVYAAGSGTARRAKVCMVAGALLVASQVFGKPTGVMYPAAALLSILLPNAGSALDMRGRLRWFFTGCAACVAAVVLLLLVSGSIAGYFHWCWRIPYVGNRFLFRSNPLLYLYTTYWERFARVVLFSLFGGVAAIATGLVPLRGLGIVVLPTIAFVGACLQGRGYDYHLMPAIAAVHLVLVLVVAGAWTSAGEPWSTGRAAVAAGALVFAGNEAFANLLDSAYRWNGDDSKWDVTDHTSCETDKEVGAFVRAHTKPDDWVYSYDAGNAHVVLMNAERRTASPYLQAYYLDPVGILSQSKVQPTPHELVALKELQRYNREQACTAIMGHRPTAVVFSSYDTAIDICPPVRDLLKTDFELAKSIGSYQIYLRKP
jgi:hypothetical protein